MKIKGRACDVLDEHFYPGPGGFDRMATRYDSYPRTGTKIFVGEWATKAAHETPDFRAALSDAAWMTGMERNSDLVVLESYAPLLVNVNPGARQWQPNLIGYDALTSFGSPSYWLQVMFADGAGDVVPTSDLKDAPPGFFYSVMRDTKSGWLFLKAVNTTSIPQPVQIQLTGATIDPKGQATVLASDDLDARNTVDQPHRLTPHAESFEAKGTNFVHTFKPQSITVLKMAEH